MPPLGRSVWSLAIQFFVNGFVYASYIPRLPEIRDQTGVSIAVLGIVLTAGNLAGLVASLFTGRVIPRVGSKKVTIIGGVFYAVALPGIGFADSAAVLVLALVTLATFDVYVDVALNYQASVVSARRVALGSRPVISRLQGAWSAGTLAGGSTAALAATITVPVQVHYSAVAAVVVITLLIVAPGLLPTDERHPEQAVDLPADQRQRGWRRLGTAALALGITNALVTSVDTSVGEWASFRLSDDFAATAGLSASVFVIFTAAMTLGRLSGDAVTAALGRLRTARLGVLVASVGLVAVTLIPHPAVTLGGVAVTALGVSVLEPLLSDVAARAPGPPGAGFTALFIGHRVSGLLVPGAIGSLAVATTSVGLGMALVALPCAVLLVALLPTVLHRKAR